MRISDWSSDVCSSDLVVDRVDRDARLADIAGNARVIAVIAAMRRQIERDRQPLLPGGEVAAVESVRFLGGGEARILPDRPREPGVHRRLHPARIGREAGETGPGIVRARLRPRVERKRVVVGTEWAESLEL